MDKQSLHPGQDYAYRANTRAWEKREDPPLRATLVESMPRGRHRLRLDNGDEIEARSSQLVARWHPADIDALLRREARIRAFSRETIRDDHVADAVELALTIVSADAYAFRDRASIPTRDAEMVREAAEIQDELLDLSPVAYLDEPEDSVCLPLPVAQELARRIAERNSDAVDAAVESRLDDLRSRGHMAIVPQHYKPAWDIALGWAGRPPLILPETEASPADAYRRLWEALRGRGVRKKSDEEHAWKLPEEMVMEIGHLLAGAASYSGRLTLLPLPEGHVRLSLDAGHHRPAKIPDAIRGLALSLSRQQQAALGELREAGPEGAAYAELSADWRTVESLVAREIVEEIHVEADDEQIDVRVCLTDAGWRVLQHLGPRSL
jgi:translation initiation factor IF-1